jgi:hypothetical protein
MAGKAGISFAKTAYAFVSWQAPPVFSEYGKNRAFLYFLLSGRPALLPILLSII